MPPCGAAGGIGPDAHLCVVERPLVLPNRVALVEDGPAFGRELPVMLADMPRGPGLQALGRLLRLP